MEIVPYKDGVQYIMDDTMPVPSEWDKQIAYYLDHKPEYISDPDPEPWKRWDTMLITDRDIDNFNHYAPNMFKKMPYVDHVNKLKRQPVGPPTLWDQAKSFISKRFKPADYGPLDSLYKVMNEDSQLPQQPVLPRALPRIHQQPQMNGNDYYNKYIARREAGPMIKQYKQQAREHYKTAVKTQGTPEFTQRLIKVMTGRRYKRGSKRYTRKKRSYGRGRRYYGRGAYYPSPGTNFGGRMGGYLGATAGEFLGSLGQRAMGLGDYSVNSNVFQGRLPEMTNLAGNGGTVIRYQEYLGDIITSGTANTFKIDSYLLNAANANTFPWMSQIAANYEQYEIQGMLFEFRSTSANALNSTNTALGTVMMATQYDTVDQPFSSKIEMLNYEFSTSCVPSSNQTHMIECDPHQSTVSVFYSEPGATNPPNTDPRLYFLGRTSIATTGFQGTNVNIGELHVTYQIKLLKPKLNDILGVDEGMYYQSFSATTGTNWTDAAPLGSNSTIWDSSTQINNLGVTRTGTSLTLPISPIAKQYLFSFYWVGPTAIPLTGPSVVPTGGVLIGGSIQQGPFNGQTSSRMIYTVLARSFPNSALSLALSGAVLPVSSGTQGLAVTICQTPIF